MDELRIDWDSAKEAANRHKHGVSFDEAESVFHDTNAKLIADPEHSAREDRFILLGCSYKLRLLVVCHTYRRNDNDKEVRIISARKATRREQSQYTKAAK